MKESEIGSRDQSKHRGPTLHSYDEIHYLLNGEEKILRSISSRLPLEKILNEICNVLDCQIGNMVSMVSLSEDNPDRSCAEIARNAALFGLRAFFSAAITAESGDALGTLQMFCCVSRQPSAQELQLIARAVCLAAIAVSRAAGTGSDGYGILQDPLTRRLLPIFPDSTN